jgi:uncharacterized protein (TIGR00251 family)
MPHTTLSLHVQPRAKTTAVAGWHGDAVKIRIAAPPVDGAANEELVRCLADQLGVPKTAVTITHGTSGRRKRVRIEGMGRGAVLTALGLEVRR